MKKGKCNNTKNFNKRLAPWVQAVVDADPGFGLTEIVENIAIHSSCVYRTLVKGLTGRSAHAGMRSFLQWTIRGVW